MYKNTPYALRALVLGTLLTTTGLGFASANTTTTTHAPATTVEATKMETTRANVAKTEVAKMDVTKTETTKIETAKIKSTNTVSPAIINTSIGTPQDIQKIRAHIFTDVPSDFWAANSISTVTKANLMKGYSDGTFRPNQPMTREEVAALFNSITDDGTAAFLSSKFKDITSDRWSALAIESVARKNIISGYGDDTYKPEKYMSRQEFAVVADNYIHYLGYTTEDPTVLDNIAYGDQKFVAPWAQDAVRELAYLGFTNYAPGTLFNPEKYVTRAEAAEIAYRMTQTELDRTVVVSKGKLNQAQLEEYQSDAIALYQQKEPQGKILSISPNTDTSALLITVDSIQKSTLKAFKKKFHDNVFLQLPPEPLTKSDGNIQFPLPPRVNYYNDKQ